MRKKVFALSLFAGLITASSLTVALGLGSFRVIQLTTEPIVVPAHAGSKACHYDRRRGIWVKDNRKETPCPKRRRDKHGQHWAM